MNTLKVVRIAFLRDSSKILKNFLRLLKHKVIIICVKFILCPAKVYSEVCLLWQLLHKGQENLSPYSELLRRHEQDKGIAVLNWFIWFVKLINIDFVLLAFIVLF